MSNAPLNPPKPEQSRPDSDTTLSPSGRSPSVRTERVRAEARTPARIRFLFDRSIDWKKQTLNLAISAGIHLLVLATCALVVFRTPRVLSEIFTTITEPEPSETPIIEQPIMPESGRAQISDVDQTALPESLSNFQFETKGPIELNLGDTAPQIARDSSSDLSGLTDIKIGNETSGRMSVQAKKAMVAKFGGNSASEAAVASGMKWLMNHQLPDGSWSFEHSRHLDCKGKCSQDGQLTNCPTGATGLALLALLGGGHTHKSGDYQRNVKRGIDFLIKSGQVTPTGLDFRGRVVSNEGMYVQGLCTIALSECAGMTKDSRVRKAAEGAIEFIVKAQNPREGGWRYQGSPDEPGDTSVVGWQVMALKSAQNAKLRFPPAAFERVQHFLDLAETDKGARYKYVPDTAELGSDNDPPTPAMTAVGLLCRMYLGWDHKNKRLAEGVAYLDKVKPDPNNMYYNYYATQVMHHWGGEEWTRWNSVMRDRLIRTQHPQKDGHLAGSWDVSDPYGNAGGRLYMTCLSVMTLEVYYRHLPLYSREKIKVEF